MAELGHIDIHVPQPSHSSFSIVTAISNQVIRSVFAQMQAQDMGRLRLLGGSVHSSDTAKCQRHTDHRSTEIVAVTE
jgi:hypothetical protein